MTTWDASEIHNSPRCELIISFHILHDLLQSLLILDVHLIADVSLSFPIIYHDGGVHEDAAPKLEVASSQYNLTI